MSQSQAEKLRFLQEHIRTYPNFPKPGIHFKDVFSLLQQPEAFKILMELMYARAQEIQPPVNAVIGVDSRGFLFGPMIALHLNIPFVAVRKKGKLPGPTKKVTYDLEYGQDILEIQENALNPGQGVLIVDDLIATGGSLNAACELVTALECSVSECLVIMELKALNGRDKVKAPVTSLLQF
ncbi:hypothetical protein B566_EDAN004376 [Ephemera danica]|nr:hypothetical protein B566_EDAN004376 [Ephemera danica]